MKNKGFTLIELLAVIVILAIIALIAVPIIINIINGTKEKSKEISKDLYLKAVEQAILKKNLKEEFNPSTCTVQKDGNLDCNGTPLVVEVEGEKPCSGTITITKGLVTGENIGYCDGTQTTSNPTAQEKLESLLDEDNTDEIFEDGNGNIRYRGKTPKNYVTFNNETWRIIGYVDNHIKLIRNESIGEMAWDSSDSNDWTKASLMKYLNPKDVSNAETDGEYWTNLTPEAKNMIEKTTWYLGGFSTSEIKTPEAYTKEIGSASYNNQPTTWEGYVGLMYPSDYGYAASEACMINKTLCDYDDATCTSSNWLYLNDENYYWTQSPDSGDSNDVWNVGSTGFVSNSIAIRSYGLRPVINLKSEVKIVNGTGKEGDPYILGIE